MSTRTICTDIDIAEKTAVLLANLNASMKTARTEPIRAAIAAAKNAGIGDLAELFEPRTENEREVRAKLLCVHYLLNQLRQKMDSGSPSEVRTARRELLSGIEQAEKLARQLIELIDHRTVVSYDVNFNHA